VIESPSLGIDSAGRLHVTWVSETAAGERTVLVASAPPGKPLSAPRVVARTGIFVADSTVGRGQSARTVRRALRTAPHLAILPNENGPDTVAILFTDARADDVGSVRPLIARSVDGASDFSAPAPFGAASAVRPTFTGCGTTPDGRLLFSWLDHRLGVQVPALAATAPGECTFQRETVLETSVGPRGVCPCCPTACAGDAAGDVFLAFRNQADGFRDIFVARRAADATAFAAVAAVVPPTWAFDGCPHDGPSLDVTGDLVTVAWMDAHEGMPRVHVATSRTDPLAFGPAQRLDPSGAGPQGNPRLCRDAVGDLHAVWERSIAAETPVAGVPQKGAAGEAAGGTGRPGGPVHGGHAGGGRLVMHARQANGGWTAAAALAAADGVIQSRPAIAAGRSGGLAMAWFERTSDGKSLVVARSGSASGTPAARAMAADPVIQRPPIAAGQLAYLQHCAGCHGATGAGNGPAAAALPEPPRSFASSAWRGPRSRAGIRRAILEGVPGTLMRPTADLATASLEPLVEHVAALAGLPVAPAEPPRVETRLIEHQPPLPSPDLPLHDGDGRAWRAPADRLTLVHVWGTSCSACLAEMPALEALGEGLADKGLAVVHLCADSTDAVEAGAVARAAAPSARVLLDPSGLGIERLGVRVLPAVRVLDGSGRIVASLDGAGDWDSAPMRAAVRALLERSRDAEEGGRSATPR
jgi:thiol-disulfide isomerase/thioredoxin/cytochrome c553